MRKMKNFGDLFKEHPETGTIESDMTDEGYIDFDMESQVSIVPSI